MPLVGEPITFLAKHFLSLSPDIEDKTKLYSTKGIETIGIVEWVKPPAKTIMKWRKLRIRGI